MLNWGGDEWGPRLPASPQHIPGPQPGQAPWVLSRYQTKVPSWSRVFLSAFVNNESGAAQASIFFKAALIDSNWALLSGKTFLRP